MIIISRSVRTACVANIFLYFILSFSIFSYLFSDLFLISYIIIYLLAPFPLLTQINV